MHSVAELAAIAKRNSKESRLLRLPGEIRNMIYDYATGHFNIYHTSDGRLFVGPIDPWEWRHAFVKFPKVSDLLALTLVCRQTYLEASLHVFANNTFDTKNFFYFQHRVEKMNRDQKKAITTITCAFDCMGKVGFDIFHLTNTIDPNEHFLVKPYLDLLPAFAGLKRVVIDSRVILQKKDMYMKHAKSMEHRALVGVWRFFQKEGMLVEFVQGPLFELRSCCGKYECCGQA